MTDQETESKNEKEFCSRRVFLASGVFALINVPMIDLPLIRFQQRQTSISFDGPFKRREKYFFDEATRKKLPFIPTNLQVGNNDIAIWGYPGKREHSITMIVSLDLYGENDHVLSSQSAPMRMEWNKGKFFTGCNVRFQFPKSTLSKAQKVTVTFWEFR
ncbi:hypothetical protein [uncultured Gimesia sp.]|uniref:hypothetical protein n=1 Tax=uncultured Gimesia sp. TaxID=1678688 RepID=UPI0030DC967D|tara:strand:+ start:5045 stop:5521 length:477 start_codon:yes stop_codon:yes gene_type:complete